MGAHHARRRQGDSASMRALAIAVILPIALTTLAAIIWLWPSGEAINPEQAAQGEQTNGRVVAVETGPCPEGQPGTDRCGTVQVRLTEGSKGDVIEAPLPTGPGAPPIREGEDVVLLRLSSPEGGEYAVVDHQRERPLWVLAIAFALALVAFARWRGVSALAGLVVTFALLVYFVVPAILGGESPLLVAIVGSAAIMLIVLYLTHGFSLSTTVAVLGTLISLTLTGVISSATVSAMHLTGMTDDISTSVGLSLQINMQGLLLAGIVIGSLGVLDDVTVTQAATVTELAEANPAYGFKDLYRAAERVGRSHIASVVNTIVLAYAGSSLPLLILIVAGGDSLGGSVTDQVIAQEIARSVVGTLGLIAAVPVTTVLAAWTQQRVLQGSRHA
ncbi:YibE/F family protein [Knoellia aerolata]|uniref:YibE/F family protein n=1 Tax=Knoellia aerolata DSM 18566 TaxID=1385519 RepID=A0A0A0JWQ1_9MICO|nr:YibE/F family protein [Knoellia aerolata]KGN41638.1 YibE/F family protein [Knoellia aerolata DSM 18566]